MKTNHETGVHYFSQNNRFVELTSEPRVFSPPARKLYWKKKDVLQIVHVDGSFCH